MSIRRASKSIIRGDTYRYVNFGTTIIRRGSSVATYGATALWSSTSSVYDSQNDTFARCENAAALEIFGITVSGYDFSSIPVGATILHVSVDVRHYESHTTSRFNSVSFMMFDDVTQIGLTQAANLSTTTRIDSAVFIPTLAQLQSATFKITFEAQKANNIFSTLTWVDYIEVKVIYLG